MRVFFNHGWDDIIGYADIEEDDLVHIRLHDPKILAEVRKHKELRREGIINFVRTPATQMKEPKKMHKVERRMTVVALEQTGENMLLNQVQVIVDGYQTSLSFKTSRDNCPALGAKITVTIEEE